LARDSATIEVRNHGPRIASLRVSGWEVVQLEDCRGLIERDVATLPPEAGMSDTVFLLWTAGEPGVPLTVSVYSQPCGEGRCTGVPEAVIIVPRSIVEPLAS
jgi:hypothetical protein